MGSDFEKFKSIVWMTRMSRVHTERRLIGESKFYQFINVYYSCATIIFSILSYSMGEKGSDISLITIFMSISLLAAILYLNPEHYMELARGFKKNYVELQKIEYKLKHVSSTDDYQLSKLEQEYCNLIEECENHCSFDYYCALHDSRDDNDQTRWLNIRHIYYLNIIWKSVIKFILFCVPIILMIYIKCR